MSALSPRSFKRSLFTSHLRASPASPASLLMRAHLTAAVIARGVEMKWTATGRTWTTQ